MSAQVPVEKTPELDLPSNIEATVAEERDPKGVSYIFSLVGIYVVFAICMAVVAWFGVFSEV